MTPKPSQARLRELFRYERRGMLRRVVGGRKPYPWRLAGKYLIGEVDGCVIYLHQAIWIYHKGELPVMLDHRDNDKRNNRIGNLRPCTNAQNQYNSCVKRTNKSGFKGVRLHQKAVNRPWQAKIVKNGRQRSLGYYATPEEAGAAYAAAAPKIAGQFARV